MVTDIRVTVRPNYYIVTATFDKTEDSLGPSTETIVIPFETISARRKWYGLASDKEAIEYIIREVYRSRNGFRQKLPHQFGKRRWGEMTKDEIMEALGVDVPVPVEDFVLPTEIEEPPPKVPELELSR